MVLFSILGQKNEIKSTLARMQNEKKIDTTLQIITCVNEDSEKAVIRAKKNIGVFTSLSEKFIGNF